MIKILPIPDTKHAPYMFIESKKICDSVDFVSRKKIQDDDYDAERLVKFWNRISSNDSRFRIHLNYLWELSRYVDSLKAGKQYVSYVVGSYPDGLYHDLIKAGLTETDIDELITHYGKFSDILEIELEEENCYLIDISIKYSDEFGKIHECEIV